MINESAGFGLESLLRGLLGVLVILVLAFLLSKDRKRIDWRLVGVGLLLQTTLAVAILYVPFVSAFFELLGRGFIALMDFTQDGVGFLLGHYASKENGFVFLIHSLPVVIFFSALISICYHWGIIQFVVRAIAWLLRKFFNISGAEGLAVSGNIFIGMMEAPLLIKNYLNTMTRSELFLVMVAGMATIAGALMGTYIGLLSGGDPVMRLFFAKHLISASLIAIPGAIVVAKMLYPQTEEVMDKPVSVENANVQPTILNAIAGGTSTGIKLMTNIAAMLLVFIALVALANFILGDVVGHYTGINSWLGNITDGKVTALSFQYILGIVLAPFMWLVGVPSSDMMAVGSLLGQKTVLNEFVAYIQFKQWMGEGMFVSQKAITMTTYILCGFANISSIGILIGGLGVLVPEKKTMVTSLGFYSMIGGGLVSVLSATIIGMILG